MADAVRTSVEDGVATVIVDSPPVNSLNEAVLDGLLAAAERIAGDDEIRSAVIAGTGEKAFIAGADLKEFARILGDREAMEEHVDVTGPVFGAWARLEVPVVAAVNAHAMGGGLEFALTCDLIVADPRALFGLPEVTLGLMPGAGGTQRLPRRIGLGAARRLALLGKPVGAEEALALGIVDEIADEGGSLERGLDLAKRLAALPNRAVRSIKRAIGATASLDVDEGVALERELFLEITMTEDARTGTEAFLARERPEFRHR